MKYNNFNYIKCIHYGICRTLSKYKNRINDNLTIKSKLQLSYSEPIINKTKACILLNITVHKRVIQSSICNKNYKSLCGLHKNAAKNF
jgi:DNA-binding sugar fermentation-stimulating protein